MAEWWNRQKDIPLNNKNFQKILNFYLFNCPVETEKGSVRKRTKSYSKVSKRAKTLRAQGWTGGYLNTLLSSMKKTSSGQLYYHVFGVNTDINVEVCNIQKITTLSDKHFELIAMVERSDMNKTNAIFYYIRNAFAHGSFSVLKDGEKVIYYFQSTKDNNVKALIRLREETLLKWIKDVSLSPTELRNSLTQSRKKEPKKKGKVA